MRYKDIDKIDIQELKRIQSANLINYIKDKNIDIENVALDLGISEEKLIKILSFPKLAKGSELLLLSKNIEKDKYISK